MGVNGTFMQTWRGSVQSCPPRRKLASSKACGVACTVRVAWTAFDMDHSKSHGATEGVAVSSFVPTPTYSNVL